MIKIKCRCGQSEKSFKKEIGPFYIDECCEKAGYDALGNKEGEDQDESQGSDEKQGEENQQDSQDESQEESEDATEDMSQAIEMTNEEVQSKREDSISYEGMTSKSLIELCKQRKVSFTKKDTIAKLIERLQEADSKK